MDRDFIHMTQAEWDYYRSEYFEPDYEKRIRIKMNAENGQDGYYRKIMDDLGFPLGMPVMKEEMLRRRYFDFDAYLYGAFGIVFEFDEKKNMIKLSKGGMDYARRYFGIEGAEDR